MHGCVCMCVCVCVCVSDPEKIMSRQKEVVSNLRTVVDVSCVCVCVCVSVCMSMPSEYCVCVCECVLQSGAGVCLSADPNGVSFLEGLLSLNPRERMSPQEALNHPFLN